MDFSSALLHCLILFRPASALRLLLGGGAAPTLRADASTTLGVAGAPLRGGACFSIAYRVTRHVGSATSACTLGADCSRGGANAARTWVFCVAVWPASVDSCLSYCISSSLPALLDSFMLLMHVAIACITLSDCDTSGLVMHLWLSCTVSVRRSLLINLS